jgi:hypothetical protein
VSTKRLGEGLSDERMPTASVPYVKAKIRAYEFGIEYTKDVGTTDLLLLMEKNTTDRL